MAGRVLPAICGPAGQGRGQDAADGAVVAVDVAIVVEGDGLAGGDLVALAGDPAVPYATTDARIGAANPARTSSHWRYWSFPPTPRDSGAQSKNQSTHASR